MAQVTATDADDPMHGNHAKLIYSILQGEPYFSIEPKTGIADSSQTVDGRSEVAGLATLSVHTRPSDQVFGCA